MPIILVTYDLKKPGKDYQPLYDYIKGTYTWCKGLESVWLLDTAVEPGKIRDDLRGLVDSNDKIFVATLKGKWASSNYYCADWLNKPERNW